MGKTLFDKIWDRHTVASLGGGLALLHVDRHLIHELTSPQAFERLRRAGRRVRNPELSFATQDHIVATLPGRDEETFPDAGPYVRALRRNAREHGIELFDLDDPRQGIVHVVAPELGLALPGTTVVCGDSHTCTLGGLGAVAFGIGTSEIEHVLATQTVAVRRPRTMRIAVEGRFGSGVSEKDLVLHTISRSGAAGGIGHAVEFAGAAVRALSVEARLTLCNMAVEFSARIGLVAPDETTFAYLEGRPYVPCGELWHAALESWRGLASDEDAVFDREVSIEADEVAPQITWGTSPEDTVAVTDPIPDPATLVPERRARAENAQAYMGVRPGQCLEGLEIDKVFIGSCTNGRLSDLRAAAEVARGRRVAEGVRALVVPGSSAVKRAAEAEGLDRVFRAAGFEWRESGCSMCVAINGDLVAPGERCISTSNRNFEGRQGPAARTHLASPAMAAAAAVTGRITDVRRLMG